MKMIYEGTVGTYTFQMVDSTTIEVWADLSGDYPESYIYVKEGAIRHDKDFHFEISDWYFKNISV